MRTLKFRAWSVRHNIMLNSKTLHELLKVELDIKTNSTDNLLLMQFTGFVDFSGKEIYEGDIVEYVYTRDATQKKKFEIHFDDKVGAWFCGHGGMLSDVLVVQNDDEWKRSQNWNIRENQYLKVIGNIYENNELVNSK